MKGDSSIDKKVKVSDPLMPFLQNEHTQNLPEHLRHVPNEILQQGYSIVPGLFTPEECQHALDAMWNFVQDTSGHMVDKNDPHSWYPKNQLFPKVEEDKSNVDVDGNADGNKIASVNGEMKSGVSDDEDPWPHTGYSSFPDMFQSLGAGFLLGAEREIMAERVFEPLFGTKELHASKEGFTFARPTTIISESDETKKEYKWHRPKQLQEVRVCGKPQENNLGEHYDQAHDTKGLHTIQSSVCFIDQKEEDGDGHFVCYPNSHSEVHDSITKDIYRGRFSWVPLTSEEVQSLANTAGEKEIKPLHIYAKAGDVILWRSDLIHAAVPPSSETTNFRSVGYFSMSPASWTPSYPGVWKEKLDAYRFFKTGDHRAFEESWHDHKRKGLISDASSLSEENWILLRQRPHYRLCPPIVTQRLAQLYGLLPYGLSREEMCKEVDRATIRGVRFDGDEEVVPSQQGPLCTAKVQYIGITGGASLPGQDKFLGGMCSPCGKYVYGVPGHAKRVLRIATETNEMDFIGPSYSGQFKWLRGLDVPVEAMGELAQEFPSGCCLALPSNAASVLKINCATNQVSTFGDIKEKGWLYHGGNLASDGFVYAIPANATRVLKIDPRNDTVEVIGPSFPGRQKWFGGIMGCDGCIYGIAQNSSGVLKIDPLSQECSILGDGTLGDGKWKWHGGQAINDGKLIIGYPNNADNILVVDVEEQRIYTVGDSTILKSGRHRIPQDGRYKYLGGASTEDGKFTYLFPCDAERVLKIDNESLSMSLVGPSFLEGENKYQNGFVAKDGTLYGIPQRASGVIRISPASVHGGEEDHVDVLYCGDEMVRIKDKFEGGVIDHDSNIYCIPLRAKKLLKIVP